MLLERRCVLSVGASSSRRVAPTCALPARRGAGAAPRRLAQPNVSSTSTTERRVIVRAAEAQVTEGLTGPVLNIKCTYGVSFGQSIRLVGSSDLLGDWSADKALQLTWTEGDVWTAEVPINPGHYEFKVVVYNMNTNAVDRWEDGDNRILEVATEPGKLELDCAWGATGPMAPLFTPAPPPPPPPAPAVDQAAEKAAAEAAAAEATQAAEAAALEAAKEAEAAVPTFQALAGAEAEVAPAEVVSEAAALAEEAAAASTSGSASGGSVVGAAAFLVATAAAVAAAAVVFSPSGMDPAAVATLRSQASSALNATTLQSSLAMGQVRSTVQTQMAALAGHVSAVSETVSEQVAAVSEQVQPAVQAQLAGVSSSVADGLSVMQQQAVALQSSAAGGLAAISDLSVAAANAAPDLRAN